MFENLGTEVIVQNTVQSIIQNQYEELNFADKESLDFNLLAMYFGDDYVVNDRITIRQPSIQDFIDVNDEENIYDAITPFVTNTTACRLRLWEMGIDWNKISNYELFAILIRHIKYEYSRLIFGDIDFSTFQMYDDVDDEGNVISTLYSPTLDLALDEDTVVKMSKYIQHLFFMFPPEEEFVRNKILKQDLINKDKEKLIAKSKEQRSKTDTVLLSMISFYLNHPGCKYTKNELRDIKYFEFIYNIQRLKVYESTRALFGGIYSGMCDLKKIKQEEFNFMRDIDVFA